MKQITIVAGLLVCIGIVSLTIMTIGAKSTRKAEMNRAVSAAAKQVVRMSRIEDNKEIKSDGEMINYFTQTFFQSMNSIGRYEIEVMDVDYKEGLLDVIVTQIYTNAIGTENKISVRKTVIYG